MRIESDMGERSEIEWSGEEVEGSEKVVQCNEMRENENYWFWSKIIGEKYLNILIIQIKYSIFTMSIVVIWSDALLFWLW
jgi:hypothetical protein